MGGGFLLRGPQGPGFRILSLSLHPLSFFKQYIHVYIQKRGQVPGDTLRRFVQQGSPRLESRRTVGGVTQKVPSWCAANCAADRHGIVQALYQRVIRAERSPLLGGHL